MKINNEFWILNIYFKFSLELCLELPALLFPIYFSVQLLLQLQILTCSCCCLLVALIEESWENENGEKPQGVHCDEFGPR